MDVCGSPVLSRATAGSVTDVSSFDPPSRMPWWTPSFPLAEFPHVPKSPLGGGQSPHGAALHQSSCESRGSPGSLGGRSLPIPSGSPGPCTGGVSVSSSSPFLRVALVVAWALLAPASEAVTPVHPAGSHRLGQRRAGGGEDHRKAAGGGPVRRAGAAEAPG